MKRLSRRQFLKGAAASTLLATPFGVLARSASDRPALRADVDHPNIILLTVDALRADHLSCYGYPKSTSPNIDRLAAESVQFTNAVSTAPWTFPAFSAIHTSMYPSELGVSAFNVSLPQIYQQRLDPLRATLAETLQSQGYRTQAIVTNPWLFPEFGFAQGFDGYLVVDRQKAYDYDSALGETLAGRIAGRAGAADSALRSLYQALMGPAGQPVWDVRADRVSAEVLSWLDAHHAERFFLWVHYIDPHYPFSPPAAYRPSIAGVSSERLDYLGSYNEDDVYTGRARLRPADRDALVALYDGEIRYVDHYVGQVLDRLNEQGLRDNTLLVLSADHGDEFWEHGGYQHGHSLYNELVHIPLIVRGPRGFDSPRRIDDVARHVDIAPTLAEAAGASFHADARGASLSSLLNAGAAPPRVAFSEGLFLTSEKKAIRDGDRNLIYDPFSGVSELYDLRGDPRELENLAARDVAATHRLKQQLTAWQLANEAKYAQLPRSVEAASDQSLIDALKAGGY